jgi:hypothetical protein
MRQPQSINALEEFSRVRLSKTFFMRDFLYSDIAALKGFANLPDDPDLAIYVGKQLCENLLEPLQDVFGRVAVRSSYRSSEVNQFGAANTPNCGSNQRNFARHIWDKRDADGFAGATACVFLPNFYDVFPNEGDWQKLAWWIHDNLPYSSVWVFPKYWAMNINWSENPEKKIISYMPPKGTLTSPEKPNFSGDHKELWKDIIPHFPKAATR